MGFWQNKKLPGLFKRRGFVYSVAFLVLVTVILGYTLIIFRQNSIATNRFNQQISGIARTSTVYLASNYELYGSPSTIKFQNIVKDFLAENIEVKSFCIFDTTGKIVFDSSSSLTGQIDADWLNKSREDTITPVKNGNHIQVLISPYFEEWGSHQYSVLFYPSYSEVNKENWQFSIELGLITFLSVLVIAGIALITTLNERFKLHQEEKSKLEKIDKQRQEFIILVAHNLRTPVTIIQGYLSMLSEMQISDEQKNMLTPVTETVRKLHLLIEQMLTITEILGQEKAIIEKQDLLVGEMVTRITNNNQDKIGEKGLSVAYDFEPDNITVFANKRFMQMTLEYIIENAIKFNHNKGSVTVNAYADNANTVIKISDSGIGIPKEEQANIFVKFHKSDPHKSMLDFNYAGVGLGLYTSKVLVEAMGGKIWFESVEDEGTTFYISLPNNTVKP